MSGLINDAQGVQMTRADDRRACERFTGEIVSVIDPMGDLASFRSEWWPTGDDGNTAGVIGMVSWGEQYPVSGCNGRFAIVGYSRDAYGSPIGGAAVKLFRTLDDSLQASVISDDNGLYQATSPFADGHYMVVYKVGPPDVCGTTINTLVPA